MRDAFVRVLAEEMERNDRIVLITGDLGFGVLRPLWERFPDRMVNAGIAEQGMVSMAAGLAATGRTVIVYSIGNFPTLRPLEQIRNDCAYHHADVKIICVGGGFVYGSLGMSHHATEDMSVMRAIPDICCFTPGDPAETEAVTPLLSQPRTDKTVAFFYITTTGTVNVRKSADYVPKMIEMAGGTYAFDDLSSGSALSTVNMTMESFYSGAKNADVLIYNSTIDGELYTVEDLLQKSALLKDFKAVQSGDVWCTGKNLFQEPMGVGKLILDIHRVLTDPEAPAELTYLHKLTGGAK